MFDDHRAVLFGGRQPAGRSNDVWVLDLTRMVSNLATLCYLNYPDTFTLSQLTHTQFFMNLVIMLVPEIIEGVYTLTYLY